MERALLIAERGRGRTSPNPIVGAVVVSEDGIVVGQGAHLVAGGPHAEIAALDVAGDRARRATLYCTLEPCSHTGRTGPCVERIAAAGVSRVVAAMADPNPKVSGRGFAILRARGIAVSEGAGREAAASQHAPFVTWITRQRPFVTLKAAVSADGFVGRSDAPTRLTGAAADRYFHRQRAEIDAIAVGSGTVIADDPVLTPRGAYRYRPLTRVVIDWRGRVPPSARVFSTLAAGPVIMVVQADAGGDPSQRQALIDRGIEIMPVRDRRLDEVLRNLAARDIVSLLVEGGPALHDALTNAALADRVQIIRTPRALGHGVRLASGLLPFLSYPPTRRLGDDVLIECDVHRTDRSDGAH